MRYRSTSTSDPVVNVLRRVRTRPNCTSPFGPFDAGSITSYVPSEVLKEIYDVEVLSFRSLLKKCGKHMLPINPVTIRTTSIERVPGTTAQHLVGNASCWLDEVINDKPGWAQAGWLVTTPDFDPALIDISKTMAIAGLRAASYDALTDLIEVRKTIGLFHDLASKMDGFIREVVRRVQVKVRNFKRKPTLPQLLDAFSKEAANYWLKFRYGIMPVVYSLEDILKTQRDLKGGIIRDKSSVSEEISESKSLNWQINSSTFASTTQTLLGTRIYRATAFGRVDLQGLGSFDPLVSAWETWKWTWILDWLIDVGSYLQAISPFAQVTTQAVCLSVRTTVERRQTYRVEWRDVSPTNRHSGNSGDQQTIETVSEYQRWASDTTVPWPRWNPQLNWKRVADLVALIIALKVLPVKLLRI